MEICTTHFWLYVGAIWCKLDAFSVWWISVVLSTNFEESAGFLFEKNEDDFSI